MKAEQRKFHFRQHPGLEPDFFPVGKLGYVVVGFLALLLGALLLVTNGSMLSGAAFLVILLVAGGTIYRVEWGFYALMAAVMTFAQFEVPGFSTRTMNVGYFKNFKEIYYLPYFSKGDANPFELHLLFVTILWLVRYVVQRNTKLRPVPVWGIAAGWAFWALLSLAYGLQRGGEFLPALWETRPVFYLTMMAVLVPQLIQTREQISNVIWAMIFGISVKAFEGIGRYIDNGWSTGGYEALQVHEDPVFIGVLLVFLLGLIIFKAGKNQRRALLFLLVPLIWGFYVGKRRAAYAALFSSFLAFGAMIPRQSLTRGLKLLGPIILVIAGYFVAFWDSSGPLAAPVMAVRSGMDKREGEEVVRDRDYLSNLYRKVEDYDLAITIQHAPLMGIGFGMRYDQPIPLVRLDNFTLRDFLPHNNVLWLLCKTGAIGFFMFWMYLNSLAFKGGGMIEKLRDPYLKAVCALCIISLISLMTAAFFDLHLVRYRTMIFTGTLIGLLGSVETADRGELNYIPGKAQ